MDPLKYLFEKPAVSRIHDGSDLDRLSRVWTYVTQKSIKGQAIADHLATHPVPAYEPLKTDFPDEDLLFVTAEEPNNWQMNFDGAFNDSGNGIGKIRMSP